jgi:hypothetical protein
MSQREIADFDAELYEISVQRTTRRNWWVLQFPDGGLHGESINPGGSLSEDDGGIPGFTLALFETREGALEEAERLWDEEEDDFIPFPTEIVIKPAAIYRAG